MRADARGGLEQAAAPDWELLERAGVPSGALRAVRARVDPKAVRAAVASAASSIEGLSTPEREALRAWLAALAHHWPARFERLAGPAGRALLERLREEPHDPNRYLKLRRIAIEQLASLVEVPAA